MKTVAIIQARMGSTRLPGKVLKKVLDKTLLEFQIERIKRSQFIDEIVIATTVKESDDEIVTLCKELFVPFFRGPEDDVLARYFQAAQQYKAEAIVRLTSDCPIIDPHVIDKVVGVYLESKKKYDYVSNTLDRSYPRGFDVEVFSFSVLERAYHESKEEHYREHVTPYIYQNPKEFNLKNVAHNRSLSKYRWTVDTNEDFILIEKIVRELYTTKPNFALKDVLDLLSRHPDWNEINTHIEQKELSGNK